MQATRHHFVPQGYLTGFSAPDEESDRFIWVYDKRPNRNPRRKSVRSIAWAPAYYAQENSDGSTDLDTVETMLARTIDNDIPDLLKEMPSIAGEAIKLSEESKLKLAFFVGLSLTRVPSVRDGLNDMYSRVAKIALSNHLSNNEEQKAFAEKHGVTVVAKPWVSLRPMIELAKSIAEAALSKHWQFFVPAPGMSFMTSDNPVVFSGASAGLKEIGPAHPGAELLMNLRKNLSLVCTPQNGRADMQVFQHSAPETRKINRGIVRAARERVFADHHSEILDNFVKKYYGEEQRLVV